MQYCPSMPLSLRESASAITAIRERILYIFHDKAGRKASASIERHAKTWGLGIKVEDIEVNSVKELTQHLKEMDSKDGVIFFLFNGKDGRIKIGTETLSGMRQLTERLTKNSLRWRNVHFFTGAIASAPGAIDQMLSKTGARSISAYTGNRKFTVSLMMDMAILKDLLMLKMISAGKLFLLKRMGVRYVERF